MGEDNLRSFHKWKNYEEILNNHSIYVYPRLAEEKSRNAPQASVSEHKNIHFCAEVPLMKISSSFIRKAIKEGKDVSYLLTQPAHKYVDEMNFYK